MVKNIYVEGIGEVVLARRRGTRSLRLSVSGDRVRIGAPFSVSDSQALKFALSRREWILKHLKPRSVLSSGARIGKAHRLKFEPTMSSSISTKLSGNSAVVFVPMNISPTSSKVQTAAKRISKKALLAEAESLFPQRLSFLATKMNVNYRSLKVKFIRSRWGSCTNLKDIVLNGYLVQLPWEVIDYVIAHELAHTKHHNHGQRFWAEVAKVVPDHKARRKLLKSFHTDVLEVAS